MRSRSISEHARLEVGAGVFEAHLVFEIGLDHGVVAGILACRVGVVHGGDEPAVEVDVEQLCHVVEHHEVGVEVDGLPHLGEQHRREQAVVRRGPEAPAVGEPEPVERRLGVEQNRG